MTSRSTSRFGIFLLVTLCTSTLFPNIAQAQESEILLQEVSSFEFNSTLPEVGLEDETKEEEEVPQKDFTNIVAQTTDYTCGPAALATLIGLLGSKSSEMQIMELAGTSMEEGTSMLGLKRAAKELGFDVKVKNISAEQLSKRSEMSLAYMKGGEGVDHYVVIKRFENETFFVADPAQGNVRYSFEDFADSYSGKLLYLSFRSDTPVVDPLTGDLIPLNTMSAESLTELVEEITDDELSGMTGKNPLTAVVALITAALRKYAVQLTLHAAERMVQYAVTTKSVHSAIQSGQKYLDPVGKSVIAVKDKVAVVLSPEMRVITVYTIDKIKSRWLSFDQLRIKGISVSDDLAKVDIVKVLKEVEKILNKLF